LTDENTKHLFRFLDIFNQGYLNAQSLLISFQRQGKAFEIKQVEEMIN